MTQRSQSLGKEGRGQLDEAVLGNEAVPRGRLRTGGEDDIKEGPSVVEPNSISDDQEVGRNRGVFFYSDRESTAWRGEAVGCQPDEERAVGCQPGKRQEGASWWV